MNLIKILHIGNVANNAYQNAKIFKEQGYDNIVLSYDYYHIMSCPEWEDAIIEGEINNQNFPQWHRVNLHGFKRPEWFIAGPFRWCVKYIIARCNNRRIVSKIWETVVRKSREIISDKEESIWHALVYKVFVCIYIIDNAIRNPTYACEKACNILKSEILPFWGETLPSWANVKESGAIRHIKNKVVQDFKDLFPERTCKFNGEINRYIQAALWMKPMLKCFDVIFAYATNPIFMYLAGVENYIAYEHGTIRDLPYEDSDLGRLMLLSYAKAKAVYCTNIDCYRSARYITKNTATPIICGLHGLDIELMIKKITTVQPKLPIISTIRHSNGPLFFCPSRHSWDIENQCFLKGEDKFLQAASKVAKQGYEFTVLMLEWGDSTGDIKEIVDADGSLSNHVKWMPPVPKNELYAIYRVADAIIDQFHYKAYGGIAFEALAAGKPVLISAGEEEIERLFFGEAVPHYLCVEADEIFEAMMEVITKTDRCLGYSANGQAWIKIHHSKQRIYQALSKAIACVIGDN